MFSNISDLRRNERFAVREALTGSFAGADVSVLNLCEQGAMIAHMQPMRIGTRARLLIRRGAVAGSAHARIVWSHLVNQGSSGAHVYQSGLIVEVDATFLDALGSLVQERIVAPDADTLERKRKKLERRERQKTDPGNVKIVVPEPATPPPDQTLLIRHALTTLHEDLEKMAGLYLRARSAAADFIIEGEPEDVIAVWEYLGREVEIGVIDRALRRR
ncbi:MAG: hypothetical protein WA208_10955 [Thermoanaerobaculia bacterium]